MHLGHQLLPGSDRALFGTHHGAAHHDSGDVSAELDRTVPVSRRISDRPGTSHGFGNRDIVAALRGLCETEEFEANQPSQRRSAASRTMHLPWLRRRAELRPSFL